MYFLQLLHLKMRWLRRPIHLTNNINPNIYRFLRQRGCKQQLLFRMKFAQFALRRLVSLIGSIARTRQFGQLLQKESETWRNMPLQRDSSFVLGRSTTFTNAIPSILLCSHSLTTLHGNLFLKATFNWNVVNKHPIPNYY